MKINRKIILFLSALCLSSTALASELTVTDLNKPILLKKFTDTITIELPANPSTGYSWFLAKYNIHLIEPWSETYKSSDKQVVGASGLALWKFKIKPTAFVVPQITKIVLKYVQPWQVGHEHQKNVKKQVIILVTQ